MRWLLLLSFFFVTLAVRADGFAYGKGFQMLHETDQLAVIDIVEEKVDVSMYIAIGGIPKGETITYVLPFWYRPDDFQLKEMASGDFRAKHVLSVEKDITRTNRIAGGEASRKGLMTAGFFGLGFIGPFIFADPLFGDIAGIARGRSYNKAVPTPANVVLTPYEVHETSHARAELYKIQAKDLQQLVAQSGMPVEYAEPLKRYQTPYFAVMRLTGSQPDNKISGESAIVKPGGIYYRFHHATMADKRGEYTYPLGTGAAWPKPILLTEIFVTCPEAYTLHITAPRLGKYEEEQEFYRGVNETFSYLAMSSQERLYFTWTTESELMAVKTTTRLSENVKAPFAWHIAYSNSNPDNDITVRLIRRKAAWRLAVVDFIKEPWPLFICSGLFMLVSWVTAGFAIVRRRWIRAGRPGALFWQTVLAMLSANGWFSLVVLLFGVLGMTLSETITVFDFAGDIASFLILLTLISVGVCGLLGIALIAKICRKYRPVDDWRGNLGLHSWLLATAVYLVLNGGLYCFLRWCESAV